MGSGGEGERGRGGEGEKGRRGEGKREKGKGERGKGKGKGCLLSVFVVSGRMGVDFGDFLF